MEPIENDCPAPVGHCHRNAPVCVGRIGQPAVHTNYSCGDFTPTVEGAQQKLCKNCLHFELQPKTPTRYRNYRPQLHVWGMEWVETKDEEGDTIWELVFRPRKRVP